MSASVSIDRPAYDEHGRRYASCQRCGMGWIEGRESVEIFGEWTTAGEREHTCPEPYPRDIAESLIAFHASSGMPMHPRRKAACVLALKEEA